jgi:hypothetical protein
MNRNRRISRSGLLRRLSAILKLSLQIGLIYAADEFSFQVARRTSTNRELSNSIQIGGKSEPHCRSQAVIAVSGIRHNEECKLSELIVASRPVRPSVYPDIKVRTQAETMRVNLGLCAMLTFIVVPTCRGELIQSFSDSGGPSPSTTVTVQAGTNYPSPGTITGRITDENGAPVKTDVQLLRQVIDQGHRHWGKEILYQTNQEGQYRYRDLVPGQYVLFVSGRLLSRGTKSVAQRVLSPAYYPGVENIREAALIEVKPGDRIVADVQLRTERGYRVSGRLTGIPPSAFVSLNVETALGQEPIADIIALDPKTGQFVVPALPNGRWFLRVYANQGYRHRIYDRREIAIGDVSLDSLDISVKEATSIPIIVNHAASWSDAPSDRTAAYLKTFAAVPQVLLTPSKLAEVSLTAAEEGDPPTATIDPVPPGEYWLTVQEYGTECLASAEYGGVELADGRLLVTSEGGPQPLQLNMRSDCAFVTATAQATAGETKGFLVVASTSPGTAPKVYPIGQTARLPIPFAPGTYKLFAFSSVTGLEYADPAVMSRFAGQLIKLAPGQKAKLSFALNPQAFLQTR